MEEGYESFKIGALIHEARLEKGLTQEQLAEKVGYLLNCKYQSHQFTEQSKNCLLSHFGKAPPIMGKRSTKEWGSHFPKN